MDDEKDEKIEAIWVNVTEGAQITGYNRGYVVQLAKRLWDQPEDSREIRVRKRTSGYELWLPDLVTYMKKRGPYQKSSIRTD
jgi:hypothetical protein